MEVGVPVRQGARGALKQTHLSAQFQARVYRELGPGVGDIPAFQEMLEMCTFRLKSLKIKTKNISWEQTLTSFSMLAGTPKPLMPIMASIGKGRVWLLLHSEGEDASTLLFC